MDQCENLGNMWTSIAKPQCSAVIFTIFSINTNFFTCLDYLYKDSWKIYIQDFPQC